MAEMSQFGSGTPGNPHICAQCEALLMDVMDGTATAAEQAFFDQHIASCVECSRMMADAQRGAAWLEMLRTPRPEPPAELLERILLQTSGVKPAANVPAIEHAAAYPALLPGAGMRPGSAKVLPFRVREALRTVGARMLQPRLAMTAAMAFFSIALTLNLTGVQVSELRASDLKPASLRRGFYQANAHVVRYYDNLRVVYELEARVHDLQRGSDGDTDGQPDDSAKPATRQQTSPKDSSPGGGNRGATPKGGTSRTEPLTRTTQLVAGIAQVMTEKGDLA